MPPQRPPTTVLVTGAGSGLGLCLCRHFLPRCQTLVAGARDPAAVWRALGRDEPLMPLLPPGLQALPLDVASEISLRALRSGLLRAQLPIDLIVHHASLRHFVGLDRLDPARPHGGGPVRPQLLAALRTTYALLDCLAEGALVVCVATPVRCAGEFGSLQRPPRITEGVLHRALQGLARDLHGLRARLAVLWLCPGGRFGETTLPGTTEWIAETIEALRLPSQGAGGAGPALGGAPGPLWIRQRRPSRPSARCER